VTPGVLTPTHVYYAQEGPQPFEPMRQEHFPWYRQQMLAGRMVAFSSLEELPAEASVDREYGRLLGIKSNLCLPLSVGGEPPVGALALNTLRTERDWPDALVKRLQLVAQIFTNALARKRHELDLRESEERLAAGADLAGLAFYEVDFVERVAFVDDRFCDVCGIPPERREALQPLEFWMEHPHPDDRERVLDLRQQLHDGRLERLTVEYRFLHPTQGEKWIHHVARVVARDVSGRTVKTFGVLRDITERRRGEVALRQSYTEIERLKDRLQAESDYLKTEINLIHQHDEVTGRSPAIRKVLHQVEQVAPSDSLVLIRGETGSGKELVAQAIHRLSPRRSHLMVKLNCAALPSGLVESELFGREKGAFTGALTRQIGRFEVADGSTLFLDEIGELSLDVHAKLLRVLETGEFERLGSPRTIKVDVRLIAATNRNLAEDIRKGRFREDLYYRLSVFPIRVPPLRERAEDIPMLVWAFLEEFSSRMDKKITQVPRRTMDALQRHPWPGNVRQLRNAIEHGAIITTGEVLRTVKLDWNEGYYTNCPLVSASNVDQELGWTKEEYKKRGVNYLYLRARAENDWYPHYIHNLDNLIRFGGLFPPVHVHADIRRTRLLGVTHAPREGGVMMVRSRDDIYRMVDLKGKKIGLSQSLNTIKTDWWRIQEERASS
jgi:formate hydrogenlyase transcriptional activator